MTTEDQDPIGFDVLGEPAPGGSFRAIPIAGVARLIVGSSDVGKKKLERWRAVVTEAAGAAKFREGVETYDGVLSVGLTFYLPRPKSYPRWRTWSSTKPDLDKLCRSTLDAMTDAGLIADDARVARLSAEKLFAEGHRDHPPGVTITIEAMNDIEKIRGKAREQIDNIRSRQGEDQ